MNELEIANKIKDVNARIDGVRKSVVGEPISGIVTPEMFVRYKDGNLEHMASAERATMNFGIGLLLRYDDDAEAKLLEFKQKIRTTYHSKVLLDGVINDGSALLDYDETSYVNIADVIYRRYEINLVIKEREAVTYQS